MNHKIAVPAFAVLLVSSIATAVAQSPQPSPASPPSILVNGSPTAAMTFPDGSSLGVRSKNGRFPLVAGPAGQSVTIQLRFAPNPTNASLIAAPLDGGTMVASQITSVAVDGTASIQFQPAIQPGLYRVLLNQGGAMSILQFWVADPQRPNAGPPALQPSSGN